MFTVYTYGFLFCYTCVRMLRILFDAYCTSRHRRYSDLIAEIDHQIEVCTEHIRFLQETKETADRHCRELGMKHREVQVLCRGIPPEYNAEVEGLILVAIERRAQVERLRASTIEDIHIAEDRLNRLQGERSFLVHERKQVPIPPKHLRKQ